jgi:hypothetical protein
LVHPPQISIHISPAKPLLPNLPPPTVSVRGANLTMGENGEADIILSPGDSVKFSYENTLFKLINERDIALAKSSNDAGGSSDEAP